MSHPKQRPRALTHTGRQAGRPASTGSAEGPALAMSGAPVFKPLHHLIQNVLTAPSCASCGWGHLGLVAQGPTLSSSDIESLNASCPSNLTRYLLVAQSSEVDADSLTGLVRCPWSVPLPACGPRCVLCGGSDRSPPRAIWRRLHGFTPCGPDAMEDNVVLGLGLQALWCGPCVTSADTCSRNNLPPSLALPELRPCPVTAGTALGPLRLVDHGWQRHVAQPLLPLAGWAGTWRRAGEHHVQYIHCSTHLSHLCTSARPGNDA